MRNLSILGGEPLCPENRYFVWKLLSIVKKQYPYIKIFIWTGYEIEDLIYENNALINDIIKLVDYLIDGQYIEEKRDITLKWRGSSNQRIWEKETKWEDITEKLKKEKINDIINYKNKEEKLMEDNKLANKYI